MGQDSLDIYSTLYDSTSYSYLEWTSTPSWCTIVRLESVESSFTINL